jgi:hypothetical protein
MSRDGTGADVVSCPNCICVCAVAFCLRYNEQTPSSTLCLLFGLRNRNMRFVVVMHPVYQTTPHYCHVFFGPYVGPAL